MNFLDDTNMTNKTFIIAELSANHNHNFDIAIESVRAAKRAGADAIKLQTYTADTITLKCDSDDFKTIKGSLWEGRYMYDLYNEAYTPWEWHKDIFEAAKQEGLICFSSPFDKTAVDFLEDLNIPMYKIASLEITDIPLIEYAAQKGKPMIISTGVATEEDIILAINTCRKVGNNDITLLKCTTEYPAPIEAANLCMIKDMAEKFNVKTGLSDHTMGSVVPIVAVAMGATIIEKHFIIDRAIGGPDSAFSMNEEEFTEMVNDIRDAEKAIGQISYELSSNAKNSRNYSRSLYVAEDIGKGNIITEKNVRSVRPGFGLHPRFLPEILGKKVNRKVVKGERFELDMIE